MIESPFFSVDFKLGHQALRTTEQLIYAKGLMREVFYTNGPSNWNLNQFTIKFVQGCWH